MLRNANEYFLDKWKEFPGPNILKYFFVIIGLLCWAEYFLEFKFASYYLSLLWGSGNMFLGLISFIAIFGCAACAFLWFPSYIWSIIKSFN